MWSCLWSSSAAWRSASCASLQANSSVGSAAAVISSSVRPAARAYSTCSTHSNSDWQLGAARGIGRATAELCTQFGATVATCDREAQDVNAAVSALFDVRDADARDVFVEGVVNKFGGVDVLVNNAGGTFFSPFLQVSEKG